jgi:amino acid adenylation domain-containing protein
MSHFVISSSQLPPEQEAIRARCFHPTGTFVQFGKEEIDQSIAQRFEKIARIFPDRVAVKTTSREITYDILNRASNQIANAILASRGEGQEPILLLLNKGPTLLSGDLGALKSGKVVISAEPSLPVPRIKAMLRDSLAKCIVTDNENLDLACRVIGAETALINIDDESAGGSTVDPSVATSPDGLAFIFYTSGSTGDPKGVARRHRDLLHNAMTNTNVLHICPDDKWLVLRSFSTHGGINDIFSVLLNGGTSYAFDINKEGLTPIVPWLISEQVTIYSSVATVYRHFVNSLLDARFPSLRLIYLGGEQILKTDADLYRKHFDSSCVLVNRMGTSETGTISYFFVDKAAPIQGNTVPIGYAAEDMELLVLDENGRELGPNDVGEIAVRSRYLSPGYWRRADLTEAKFLQDPNGGDERIYLTGDLGVMAPDGCVTDVGRKDFRAKVRGYGVEVSEVDRKLLAHSGIKDAVVLAREDRPGETRLVGYVVPVRKPAPTISELRMFLKETLPDYMVPAAWVLMDSMPRAPSGKVDRRALPIPPDTRPELATPFTAPRTPVEEELAAIWAALLSLDQVGIHDNFFDLGGHSLLATRIISRVVDHFQLELPIQSLFQSPTVAEMASIIMENQTKNLDEENLRRIVAELELLSDDDAGHLIENESKLTTKRG